jgi:hypothetical protein
VVVGASCMVPPNDKVSVRLAVPLWKRRRRAEGKGGGAGIRRERSHANSIFSTGLALENGFGTGCGVGWERGGRG